MSAISGEPTVTNLKAILRSVVNIGHQSPIYPLFFLIKPCVNTGKAINEQARTKFGKKVMAGLSRHMILMNERIEVK